MHTVYVTGIESNVSRWLPPVNFLTCLLNCCPVRLIPDTYPRQRSSVFFTLYKKQAAYRPACSCLIVSLALPDTAGPLNCSTINNALSNWMKFWNARLAWRIVHDAMKYRMLTSLYTQLHSDWVSTHRRWFYWQTFLLLSLLAEKFIHRRSVQYQGESSCSGWEQQTCSTALPFLLFWFGLGCRQLETYTYKFHY